MITVDPKAILSFAMVLGAFPAYAEEPRPARMDAVKTTYQEAIRANGEGRLSLMRELSDMLESILNDYPSSEAAIDILLLREVGGLDLAEMDNALLEALGDRPPSFNGPGSGASASAAIGAAAPEATGGGGAPQGAQRAEGNVSSTSVRGVASAAALPNALDNAPAKAEPTPPTASVKIAPGGVDFDTETQPAAAAPPQGQFSRATEASEQQLELTRQDIREIQARLTALGIDPNGIDGVAGRGTRSALQAWQQSSGLPPTGYLDAPQLDNLRSSSQPAYDEWLADPKNRARVELVAITPARMSGSWRFVARCGRDSKLPGQTITGVMAMRHIGGNNFRGSVRNSQGLRGAISGRIADRNITTVIDWGLFFGRVQMRGQVSDDARSVNGRDSNGCRVTATKT